MKIIYVFIIVMILASCSGDTASDEAPEDLQTTFDSKPTDKQVIDLLKKKGRYDIDLSDGAGKNSTYELRKRWQKGFAYKVNANLPESPDATILIGGFVQFQINGENYEFDAIKQITTEYFGLQIPDEQELVELINSDFHKFFPFSNKLVFDEPVIKLAESEKLRDVVWDSFKSFRVNFDMYYTIKDSSRRVTKNHCIKGVRFFRSKGEERFDNFLREQESCEVLETTEYSYEEYQKLPILDSLQKK